MNGFAVAWDDANFDLLEQTIGIWNLQGVLGSQRLVVDVLLRITPKEFSLKTITLQLPFDLSEDGKDFEDLAVLWEDRKVGVVPAWYRDFKGRVKNPVAARVVIPIVVSDRSRVSPPFARKSSVSSTVVIGFPPRDPGKEFAIALRFYTGTQSSFVLWKRSFFGINGMIFDLKNVLLSDDSPVAERSTFALILRAYMQPKFSVPVTVEASIVENGPWTEFLGRQADLRGEAALVCYSSHTKNKQTEFSDAAASADQNPPRPTSDVASGDPSPDTDPKPEESPVPDTDPSPEESPVPDTDPGPEGDSSPELDSGPEGTGRRLYLDVSREFGLLPFGNFFRLFWVFLAAWVIAYSMASKSWNGWAPRFFGGIGEGLRGAAEWIGRSDTATFVGLKLTGLAAVVAILAVGLWRARRGGRGVFRPIQLSYARWERRRLRNRERKRRPG